MKWVKFTEREIDFFTASCIAIGYTTHLKKYIGVNFRNFLMIYKKGVVASYREQNEFRNILKLVRRSKNKFESILDALQEKNLELKKYLKIKDLSKYDEDELKELFSEFSGLFCSHFPLFTLPRYYGEVFDWKDFSRKVILKLRCLRGKSIYEQLKDKFLPVLFGEIGSRKRMDSNLLYYCTPHEIESLLSGKNRLSKSNLLRRKRNLALLVRRGKFQIFASQAADLVRKAQIGATKIFDSKEIKGKTAWGRGRIRGKARVVLYKDQISNLKRMILIMPMIQVRFARFLKGVKAIVTDEGGIGCHAAIISRELKIPCIVGTRYASKIIKDSDLVEVDANKGVVKKL